MNCTSESQKFKVKRSTKWMKKTSVHENALFWNEIPSDDDDLEDDFSVNLHTNQLRIFVGTWNVGGRPPVGNLSVDLEEWLNLKDPADVYVLGFQEIVPLKARHVIGGDDRSEATNWNILVGKTLNEKTTRKSYNLSGTPSHILMCSSLRESSLTDGRRYQLIATKKLVGVLISVWMKKEMAVKHAISNIRACSVGCGIMGYLGNKGSVSISMSIGGTTFCFVCAHLASGEKKGDENRRNHQVVEIFKRTSFPSHPCTISEHDCIFWFGDLNYRLYLEDSLARHLIQKEDWKGLQEFDQLRRELDEGGVFEGWKEGSIEFAPTYKYSAGNSYRYSGGTTGKTGEKQRTPAWCDRILWNGKGLRQLSYVRSESKFSDHRPVSALYLLQPEEKTARPPVPLSLQNLSQVEG